MGARLRPQRLVFLLFVTPSVLFLGAYGWWEWREWSRRAPRRQLREAVASAVSASAYCLRPDGTARPLAALTPEQLDIARDRVRSGLEHKRMGVRSVAPCPSEWTGGVAFETNLGTARADMDLRCGRLRVALGALTDHGSLAREPALAAVLAPCARLDAR